MTEVIIMKIVNENEINFLQEVFGETILKKSEIKNNLSKE